MDSLKTRDGLPGLVTRLLFGWLALFSLLSPAFANDTDAAVSPPRRPLKLLVDEYHQRPLPPTFSQGFSLIREERPLTYHYATDASGIVNGLFVLARLIEKDYEVHVSRDPIDANLADRADAFVIICPPGAKRGGPHPLTEEDADHLESFVAGGGILILAYNSITSLDRDVFDYEGMNRIAQRFGMELLPTTTRTLTIPIGRDHPVFFGVRNIIYGNGCTIAVHAQPHTQHTVLLESTNPDVPGAVAVRARHHRGTVLLIGDAGTLGNAHMAREDVGQIAAVEQLFHCLLPDGPLPKYGWKDGLRIRVSLSHELGIAGAPEGMRLLDLPLHPAAKSTLVGVRDLDLQSAPQVLKHVTPEEAAKLLPPSRYALARANWEIETELTIGADDGLAYAASWNGPNGSSMACRITPRGDVMDMSVDSGDLADWRWVLAGAAILSPLDAAARIGDEWTAPVDLAIPNVQLRPTPIPREAEARFRLVRREMVRGRDCLVVTRTIVTPLDDLRPQEIINPEFADYFNEQRVRLRHTVHAELLTSWIDVTTRLPVRTELQTSTTFWWTDRNEEDWYLSDHDHRVFETSHQTRRVTILGRLLSADFEVVDE